MNSGENGGGVSDVYDGVGLYEGELLEQVRVLERYHDVTTVRYDTMCSYTTSLTTTVGTTGDCDITDSQFQVLTLYHVSISTAHILL